MTTLERIEKMEREMNAELAKYHSASKTPRRGAKNAGRK